MIGSMDDETILTEIGGLLRRVDPVPEELTLAARSAFAWRRMDAELAQLLHDSTLETEPLAGIRGSGGGWRALTFEAPDGLSIEVEVGVERSKRSIIGQIVPPAEAKVVVRFPGADLPIAADALGRFQASDLRAGPVSLRCEFSDGRAIETGWVTI
jgi:hypothetical protein